jgi:hypothetical protein
MDCVVRVIVSAFHLAERVGALSLENLCLGLTAFLESIPIKDAVTPIGVENHFACFPRAGEAPTTDGLLTQPRLVVESLDLSS